MTREGGRGGGEREREREVVDEGAEGCVVTHIQQNMEI